MSASAEAQHNRMLRKPCQI